MKITTSFLVALLFTSTLPALAGPAGAVFCKDSSQRRTLSAYDIAVRESSGYIYSFEAQAAGGRRVFQMETYKIKPELIDFTDKVATVRYVKPNGQNAQALVAEFSGNRVATVDSVQFFNDGMEGNYNRKGYVVVHLKDGPTTELVYKDCIYEGALVDRWEELFSKN